MNYALIKNYLPAGATLWKLYKTKTPLQLKLQGVFLCVVINLTKIRIQRKKSYNLVMSNLSMRLASISTTSNECRIYTNLSPTDGIAFNCESTNPATVL